MRGVEPVADDRPNVALRRGADGRPEVVLSFPYDPQLVGFVRATADTGELFLSTDEDPAHKEKIALCPSYASPREYEKFPDQQKSKPIELKAGRRYSIEAIHQEGGGGDHVSVKWQLPNGQQEAPIPGSRLSPFVPVKK